MSIYNIETKPGNDLVISATLLRGDVPGTKLIITRVTDICWVKNAVLYRVSSKGRLKMQCYVGQILIIV